MSNLLKITIPIFITLFSFKACAQKGLPPSETKKMKSVTHYAQNMDFDTSLLKLLKVPQGWKVSVAASGLGKPRMLYVGPNGNLYVTRRDAGDVLMLTDKEGDNKFESLKTVAANFDGVHGITIKEGWMYLCNNKELRRYKINPDGTLVSIYETLINDMPNAGQHPNRTIEFGPDSMLYLSIGSTCNDCREGKDMATIQQIDPKTWKRTLFASGLRNTIGFDWHPQTKEMWGCDNGGDTKGDDWPPEELNHIKKNGNYGFPFAYGKKEVDETREDPPGDTKVNWVKTTEPSMMEFTAHSAPIAFRFFGDVENVPAEYKDDALVCWHGSWNRSKSSGYKVERIKFVNGQPAGSEDFLSGFLIQGGDEKRFGRPAGVIITPKGVVYISDDANGVIYAVSKM